MRERLFSGKTRLGLICGGEALFSKKIKAGSGQGDSLKTLMGEKQPWMAGDLRDPLTPLELKYGLLLPIHIYPLFENALRHHEGLSIDEHFNGLCEFCSTLSSIASKNRYAWFNESRTVDEIKDVSGPNRIISWPYTKYMCSIMNVDQSAALFVTDVKTAVELGVPEEKWIYLLGAGDASDIWHVTERTNFYSSPSAKIAAQMALEGAGTSIDKIDYFDLYSCFPSAMKITRNMLEIPKNDPRSLTVTGSMPYFGGPGNNYSMHAICSMVELLRKNPDKIGLIQALSWYISKHSVGIYSGVPGDNQPRFISPDKYQKELNRVIGPSLIEEASGNATVETYTLFHDRDGKPTGGIVVGRINDNRRFLAKTEMDADALEAMTNQEVIGNNGKVRSIDGINYFRI
ncbi:MAG: acetyl-CoA acetyltransferase [Deltaproteobacteria bacterium]|nr:acetyl-CoA acetyltransferase [Deltaproteobacteria bacterium]